MKNNLQRVINHSYIILGIVFTEILLLSRFYGFEYGTFYLLVPPLMCFGMVWFSVSKQTDTVQKIINNVYGILGIILLEISFLEMWLYNTEHSLLFLGVLPLICFFVAYHNYWRDK